MKRLAILSAALLLLSLVLSAALADPMPQGPDLSGSVTIPYDAENPDAGHYAWSYVLPYMDESDPDAYRVNTFYDYFISDSLENGVPLMAESWAESGITCETAITYTPTCNNDDFISFLVCRSDREEGSERLTWEGHVFSRKNGMPNSTYALPNLLGTLEADDRSDTWLEDRQTEKANRIVRGLVWDMLQKMDLPDRNPDFTEEILSLVFYPEHDFYLDASGNPVFFLQPGYAAPESAGRLDFPIPLEDLIDEL